MSKIYFHSSEDDATLLGSERAYAGFVCSGIPTVVMASLFDDDYNHPASIRKLLPTDHYLNKYRGHEFTVAAKTWWRVGEDRFAIGDREGDPFEVSLNTALRIGGDSLRLLARLHGQCEIHAWVDGNNRLWLADIIEQGERDGVLRDNTGWASVRKLLTATDQTPIVTSYSVCEQFPSISLCLSNGTFAGEGDDWYNLDEAERWELGLRALLKGNKWLEMKPDNWNDYYFGHGLSAFTLLSNLSSPSLLSIRPLPYKNNER